MKIVFTGGGSGGHFYPIVAVAQEIRQVAREKKLVEPELYFFAPEPYDEGLLFDLKIEYRKVGAGKSRIYKSALNFFDKFKTFFGILKALKELFSVYPDVVFGKGGYASFPTLMAARILRIPVIIHESDSTPGRVNKWASKFAKKIAVSYPQAAEGFDPKVRDKIAWTGNPVRKEIRQPTKQGAHEFLNLESSVPTILVLGGSQGAQIINDAIYEALPQLVIQYQIIHQVGPKNLEEAKAVSHAAIGDSAYNDRYKVYGYLNDLAMKMSAGAADLVISRAGSTIFEIAEWGIPSIIIPITESQGDHQRKNAYNYARTGAAIVIEESNLNPAIIQQEIDRLLSNDIKMEAMRAATKEFARENAARLIGEAIIEVLIKHAR